MPFGIDGDETIRAVKDSVVVLYFGGRLQSWDRLTEAQRADYSRQHVELMLAVAHEHEMMQLEGFKLLSPKQPWERFWAIEFPTLEGAEAWIEAEMAPPYGTYGYYEYHLARRWAPDYFAPWVANPAPPTVPGPPPNPADLPTLEAALDSFVLLEFARMLPEAELTDLDARGNAEHVELMVSTAREHGLMRLDGYQLIAPQADWHRAYVIELPTLQGAEAWMDAELVPPQGAYANKIMHLARRWAPEFFAGWVPRAWPVSPATSEFQ